MSKGVKAIIAIIIVLLVVAVVFAEGWALFVAAIGGIIVFLGLWIEHEADKEDNKEYLSNLTEEARRPKLKGRVGFWILMVGILIEILVAGFEAVKFEIMLREIKEQASANDPLKKPILSISAKLRLRTKGEILFRFPQDPFDARCRLMFIRGNFLTNRLPESVTLAAGGNDISLLYVQPRSEHPGEHEVIIRFEMVKDPFLQSMTGSPHTLKAGVFDEVGGLIVEFPELGTNVFVLSGDVAVEVNSSLRWEFPIPPQKPEYGFVSSQIVTNASRSLEARILTFPIEDWSWPARFTNRVFDGK